VLAMFIETHADPTGTLTLAIDRAEDGTVSIGFAGFPWHVHPCLLTGEFGATDEAATEGFKDAVLGNRLVIAIVRKAKEIIHVSITGCPDTEADGLPDSEELELRYWNGSRWTSGDPTLPFG